MNIKLFEMLNRNIEEFITHQEIQLNLTRTDIIIGIKEFIRLEEERYKNKRLIESMKEYIRIHERER